MGFREVSVIEVREVLRVWLEVAGLPAPGYRTIAGHCGWTARPRAATWRPPRPPGCAATPMSGAVDDELIGVVVEAVRPARPDGHGAAWEQLLGFEEQITAWVAGDG